MSWRHGGGKLCHGGNFLSSSISYDIQVCYFLGYFTILTLTAYAVGMAAKKEENEVTAAQLDFPAAGRIVTVWQQKGKGVRKKRSRQSSKEVSEELIELANEHNNKPPHELAFEGELGILRARIDAYGVSLKAKGAKGETLLHSATSGNQIDTMLYLIESGVPLDAVDADGNTALHIAVINQFIESIHLLLNHNASDTILNANDDAPLHIAVRSGNTHLVEAFLQHTNIDVVVPGYRKRTPLHIAAEYDYVEIVNAFNNCILVTQELKEKNSFRLCAADEDKLTPIHFAARCGSAKVLDFMIQNCNSHGYPIEIILQFLDEENSTPLHAAIDAGHLNIVKVLLKHGASPNVINGAQIPPIHLACYQGRIDIVQAMIEHCGTDIIYSTCTRGQTPLHCAARSIHGGQVIRYLVQHGANPKLVNNDGDTALHTAITHSSLESTQELIAVDQSIACISDSAGRNIIHLAVLHKRRAILQYIISFPFAKELARQPDNSKRTPLHYALMDSLGEYVSFLVSAMQPHIANVKDESGLNYLHLAAISGNWKALRLLLSSSFASSMLNEVASSGATPLHKAAMHGHLQCIEILLSEGAMLHKCYHGYTPFLGAVANGHYECAKVLFEAHPFQKNITNDQGDSALHLAVASYSSKVLKLCLNLNIPIIRNNNNETFLDQIINKGNLIAARAVISHDRWHECLDFPVLGDKPHYFIQLIHTMPDIAYEVLDRCHEKGCQPKEHIDYFERFDFKYLRLANVQPLNSNSDIEKNDEEVPLFDANDDDDMMKSLAIKYKSKDSSNLAVAFATRSYSSMEVLKQMLSYNRIALLTHPVVLQYLKVKWRGYGRLIYGTQMFLFILQVLLLSTFILITPPPRLNVSDVTFDVLSSNLNGTMLTDVTTSSTVIRSITLAVCLLNTIIWLANAFSLKLEALNITKHELFVMEGLTLASTYAFLIPWKFHAFGFTFVFWQAGAIAIFSAWFTTGLFLKPFDLFGVYVTMFLEVVSSLLKALLVSSLFIIAFAFALFILVGDITPFTSIGDSFFMTASYLLGEINYETYVRRSDQNSLAYSSLTYIFVLLAAALLAVSVMNLLIGLAVGDIETIKQNALLKQRSTEIRIFTKMEPWMPKVILQHYDKRFHNIFPNEPVSVIRRMWRYFWRSLKSFEQETPNLERILEKQQLYINCLQQEIAQAKSLHQQQHEELKDLLESIVRQRTEDQTL